SRPSESNWSGDDGGCGVGRGPPALSRSIVSAEACRRSGEPPRPLPAGWAMTAPLSRRGPGGFVLTATLIAGLALRLGKASTSPIWFDEATTGVMGRDILHGEFPFFFYGQTFMGAVDGYLHAVTFALLGESIATLRAGAVLVSLGHVALAALLGHRVFRAGGGAAALAVVAAPYL